MTPKPKKAAASVDAVKLKMNDGFCICWGDGQTVLHSVRATKEGAWKAYLSFHQHDTQAGFEQMGHRCIPVTITPRQKRRKK